MGCFRLFWVILDLFGSVLISFCVLLVNFGMFLLVLGSFPSFWFVSDNFWSVYFSFWVALAFFGSFWVSLGFALGLFVLFSLVLACFS